MDWPISPVRYAVALRSLKKAGGFGLVGVSNAVVRVNGFELGVATMSSVGDLEFILNTNLASTGRYEVKVEQSGVSALTIFLLISEGDQHRLTGSGTIIAIPQGISIMELFLPVIQR